MSSKDSALSIPETDDNNSEFITLPCGNQVLRSSRITPTTPCGDSSLEKGTPTPQVQGLGRRWDKGFANGLKGRIINFTPSWFSTNMGTGIVSIILHNLPYQFRGLRTIATIIFGLNIVLFIIFTLMTIARYLIWPKIFALMIYHPVQSLFWGTFSMAFSGVVSGIVIFCVPAYGGGWINFAWTLWWIAAAISILIGVGIPFMMFTRHKNDSVAVITAVWLLPVVSPIVAAATGGIVANVLPASDARLTIIVSYFLLGLGLAPAVLMQALYLQRLAIYKLPASSVIVSVYIPIGCNGQSAFVLVQLATALRRVQSLDGNGLGGILTVAQNETIVLAIYGVSFISAFFLMGLGFFWLIIAIATTLDLAFQGGFPFNAGWQAFVFPIATMTTASIILAAELDSEALRIMAMILAVPVVLFWLFVSVKMAVQAFTGKAFIAPCLGATSGRAPA